MLFQTAEEEHKCIVLLVSPGMSTETQEARPEMWSTSSFSCRSQPACYSGSDAAPTASVSASLHVLVNHAGSRSDRAAATRTAFQSRSTKYDVSIDSVPTLAHLRLPQCAVHIRTSNSLDRSTTSSFSCRSMGEMLSVCIERRSRSDFVRLRELGTGRRTRWLVVTGSAKPWQREMVLKPNRRNC